MSFYFNIFINQKIFKITVKNHFTYLCDTIAGKVYKPFLENNLQKK